MSTAVHGATKAGIASSDTNTNGSRGAAVGTTPHVVITMPAKETEPAEAEATEPTVEPTVSIDDVLAAQATTVRMGGSCSNPNWTPTTYEPYVP